MIKPIRFTKVFKDGRINFCSLLVPHLDILGVHAGFDRGYDRKIALLIVQVGAVQYSNPQIVEQAITTEFSIIDIKQLIHYTIRVSRSKLKADIVTILDVGSKVLVDGECAALVPNIINGQSCHDLLNGITVSHIAIYAARSSAQASTHSPERCWSLEKMFWYSGFLFSFARGLISDIQF